MSLLQTATKSTDGFTRNELVSIWSTIAVGVTLACLAAISVRNGLITRSVHNGWILCLAASVGGLGGLAHEIALSGGKILLFQRGKDSFYIGSLAGTVLGAVSGILAARYFFGQEQFDATQISYETFTAGLALKGLVGAAGIKATTEPENNNPSSLQGSSVTKPVFPTFGAPPSNVPDS